MSLLRGSLEKWLICNAQWLMARLEKKMTISLDVSTFTFFSSKRDVQKNKNLPLIRG